MKNKSKIIFSLIALFFLTMAMTCKDDENHHRTIAVINNSEKAIYVCCDITYPDTLSNAVGGVLSQPEIYKVEPRTKNTTALWDRDFWEINFKDERYMPSDTLMVFIMDAELLESRTTHVNNTIIRRYDLSLQDLQYLNWTLSYPPSPKMSTTKMHPPYGH